MAPAAQAAPPTGGVAGECDKLVQAGQAGAGEWRGHGSLGGQEEEDAEVLSVTEAITD